MIITRFTDIDLYKLTVCEIIFTYFRNVKAKYRMTVRNGEQIDYWAYVNSRQYDNEIDSLKELSLTAKEAAFLRSLNLFSEPFIEFLMDKPMKGVYVTSHYTSNQFSLHGVPEFQGEWCRTMLYEIFSLSISNEMYTQMYCSRNNINPQAVWDTAQTRLESKIRLLNRENPINLIEFGTRRRMSLKWQAHMLETLVDNHKVFGTSNVMLAMDMGIPVKGTFGHELPMGMQGIVRIQDSQKETFLLWKNHWKGKLLLALDDTLGDEKFFRDFDLDLKKSYDGLRHDSGDPVLWSKSRIYMYERADIDPLTKTLFYSDGLDISKAIALQKQFGKQVKTGFGIGTNLSNDSFVPVPQVVTKIIECNGQPVAKLSNNPAKASCTDPKYLEYLKHAIATY